MSDNILSTQFFYNNEGISNKEKLGNHGVVGSQFPSDLESSMQGSTYCCFIYYKITIIMYNFYHKEFSDRENSGTRAGLPRYHLVSESSAKGKTYCCLLTTVNGTLKTLLFCFSINTSKVPCINCEVKLVCRHCSRCSKKWRRRGHCNYRSLHSKK